MFTLFTALIVDRLVGEPAFLWKRIGHPVVWIGAIIAAADRLRSRDALRGGSPATTNRIDLTAGAVLIAALLAISVLVAWLLSEAFALLGLFGWLLEVAVVSIFIAQKSLADHVRAVATGLRKGGVVGGRAAVSQIVGRDTSELDTSGIVRAGIESLAENMSDGVVAPAFWYACFGLPGLLFYKAVNTADSMIGHRNADYEFFGKAAARTDDVLNWPAARISAALVWLLKAHRSPAALADGIMRDAPAHVSPNAGWPEAAFAHALDIQLGGPRRYRGSTVPAAVLNSRGRGRLVTVDIDRALVLFSRCCTLGACLVALLGLLSL